MNSDLRKVVLIKDYPIRHDMVIETGAAIWMSENRALQLARKGFLEVKGDAKKATKKALKDARIKKEDTPAVTEIKIEDNGS